MLGDYFVRIEDANGCIKDSPVATVTEQDEIVVTTTKTDLVCTDICNGTAGSSLVGGCHANFFI